MDVSECRKDFPTMRNDPGVYLDSACQSLRPDSVIAAVSEYYERCPACGGRSVHHLSNIVSERTDETREALCRFLGGCSPSEFVFTRNATEGINTVACGLGLRRGDAVVTTDMEHNSNHVPWLQMRDYAGIRLRRSVSRPDGTFDMESLKGQMGKDVRLVSVTHCSNVTGCTVPLREVAEVAHDAGALVMVDGAQGAPHVKVDLERLGVNFYSLSVHKMLGPSGMGVLYGAGEALEALRPLHYGGGMVGMVTYDGADLAPAPERFEAGLQDFAGIFGTKAAIEYLERVGMESVERHDRELMGRIFAETEDIRGLSVIGPADPGSRSSVFSFNMEGLGSYDVAMMLDSVDGVMIRSGMHCAHPYFAANGVDGGARASVYLYNNAEDIARFGSALRRIAESFGGRRPRTPARPARFSAHRRSPS